MKKIAVVLSLLMTMSVMGTKSAHADIITFDSYGAFSAYSTQYGLTQENVMAIGGDTGTTVQGTTNQTASLVNVSSTTELSLEAGEGQARITAASPATSFSDFWIDLPEGDTFTSLAFNMDNVRNSDGSVTLTVLKMDNTIREFAYDVANGSNFFGVVAIEGDRLVRVGDISFGSIDYQALEQIRIGGLSAVPTAVP